MTFHPIEFVVHGEPQPAGSKKAFVNKKTGRAIITDDAKKSRPWKNQVAEIARQHYRGEVLRVPVQLRLCFVIPRPMGHFGSGRNASVLKASAPDWPAKKPDVTKLIRAVEDALKGVVWIDDVQVVQQHAEKRWGPSACVIVRIVAPESGAGVPWVGKVSREAEERMRQRMPGEFTNQPAAAST